MLLVMIVLISAATALSLLRFRAGLHSASLGWISEEWLEEHRLARLRLDV